MKIAKSPLVAWILPLATSTTMPQKRTEAACILVHCVRRQPVVHWKLTTTQIAVAILSRLASTPMVMAFATRMKLKVA